MAETPADRHRAEQIKAEANELFSRGKYNAAIDRYTEAITIAPSLVALYVNRALCHRKLEQWTKCEANARSALELFGSHMKACYLLGLALRKQFKFAESSRYLGIALEAAYEARDSIRDDIWREVAACKFAWWSVQSQVRRDKRARLQGRLHAMMDEHYRACPSDASRERDERDLQEVFDLAARADSGGEADHAYLCALTMEPFRDPVTTPDGNSYERSALLEHLRQVGEFEPTTRSPLTASKLVVNRKLRAATQQYLDEHPWLWEECINASSLSPCM